jgi:hypothetical protein
MINPAAGSIPKVNGTNRARPIVAVRPGIDPKIMPSRVPKIINSRFHPSRAWNRPLIIPSVT